MEYRPHSRLTLNPFLVSFQRNEKVVTELPWSLLISIRDTLLERSVATDVTASWAFEVLLYLYTAFCLLYAYVSVLIVILVCFYFHGDTVVRKALGTDELELLIENFDQP